MEGVTRVSCGWERAEWRIEKPRLMGSIREVNGLLGCKEYDIRPGENGSRSAVSRRASEEAIHWASGVEIEH